MPHVSYFWDEIEDNVVEEYDGDTGATIASYTTEPTMYGSVLSQDRSGENHYFQFDGQGNTTELSSPAGNVTDVRRFSAFGTSTVSIGLTETPWQWGGRWGYASGTAGLYIRTRMYCTRSARLYSVDPMHNHEAPYSYCRSQPTRCADPMGMTEYDDAFAVIWPVCTGYYLKVVGHLDLYAYTHCCMRTSDPLPKPKPKPNGCSWSFDNPMGWKFGKCCDEHDICYDTCGSTRKVCDGAFKKCLYKQCEKQAKGEIAFGKCANLADLYVAALRQEFFDSAQNNACYFLPCACPLRTCGCKSCSVSPFNEPAKLYMYNYVWGVSPGKCAGFDWSTA